MNVIRSITYKMRAELTTLWIFLSVGMMVYGLFRLVSFNVPVVREEYNAAYQSGAGDRPALLYDLARKMYRQANPDYRAMNDTLTEAYGKSIDESTGEIASSRIELAAEIQFVLGNALVNLEEYGAASEAYKQCLRHAPDHMEAKYNLELLKQGGLKKPGGPNELPGDGKRNGI